MNSHLKFSGRDVSHVRKNMLNLVNKRNSLFTYSVHKKELGLAKTFHIRHLVSLPRLSKIMLLCLSNVIIT